jgi:hypothetical protein
MTLFITANCLAHFETEWKSVESMDKSFLKKDDAVENSKNEINTEDLGVKKEEITKETSSYPKDQSGLESRGQQKYFDNSEDSKLMREMHDNTNESNPDVVKYLKMADEVVEDTDKLLKNSLLDFIKKETGLDINCVPIEGKSHLRDDPYVMGYDKEQVKDEIYEPFFCEKLYNTYDCKDDLFLKCLQFASKDADFKITNVYATGDKPNIKWKAEKRNFYVEGTFYRANRHAHYKRYYAGQISVLIDVDVRNDPQILDNFVIEHLSMYSVAMVKVNNQVVFVYPGGGTDLRPTGGYKEFRVYEGKDFWGNKKYFYYDCEKVSTGGDYFSVNETHPGVHSISNVNLTPYLRLGFNRIEVKVVGSFDGSFNARFKVTQRECLKWYDEWRETCTLRKY